MNSKRSETMSVYRESVSCYATITCHVTQISYSIKRAQVTKWVKDTIEDTHDLAKTVSQDDKVDLPP